MLDWSQAGAGAVAVDTLKLKYVGRMVGEVFCSAADPRNTLPREKSGIFLYLHPQGCFLFQR